MTEPFKGAKLFEQNIETTIRALDELLKALRAADGVRVGPLAAKAADAMRDLVGVIQMAQRMGLPLGDAPPDPDYDPNGSY